MVLLKKIKETHFSNYQIENEVDVKENIIELMTIKIKIKNVPAIAQLAERRTVEFTYKAILRSVVQIRFVGFF